MQASAKIFDVSFLSMFLAHVFGPSQAFCGASTPLSRNVSGSVRNKTIEA
jgi:hypothetical protein